MDRYKLKFLEIIVYSYNLGVYKKQALFMGNVINYYWPATSFFFWNMDDQKRKNQCFYFD